MAGAPYIFEFIWPNKPCNIEYFLVFFVANQYLVIEYTWPYSTIGGWFLNISLSARPTAKILAVREQRCHCVVVRRRRLSSSS